MVNRIIYILVFLLISINQNILSQSNATRLFPQEKINEALNKFIASAQWSNQNKHASQSPTGFVSSPASVLFKKVFDNNEQDLMVADTIIVGAQINDTLVITGNFTHTGPILVFNNGVLIFNQATVVDTGEIYVFGNGKLFADSTLFTFPQQYIYERSLIVAQNGFVQIKNSSFNYSGMSHNLYLADSAVVEFTNIHQNDFTTCGLYGNANININGCNITGEYILTDKCQATFKNADTLILWHHFPDTAVVNYSFPPGDTVYNYVCNNSTPGISGIGYQVSADSCHNVMWALMPVNGSDVTISNSNLRLIGCWFERGDVASVSGIFNNSNYSNYTAPLADRNLHLINTNVQTWSFYVFDSSQVDIDSCQLGEVGTQQSAFVHANNLLLDGSGGYFWATDSSGILALGTTIYTMARSEKKGIFILAYGWQPFMAPTALSNSLMVCVQSTLGQDPVPYDGAVAWMQNISSPDTAIINTIVPINGSAWIDQGPSGAVMDFDNYSLYWSVMTSNWAPIVSNVIAEVHNNGLLGSWNTNGLVSGNYFLRLVMKNNLGDSLEAIKPVYLKQLVSVNELTGQSLVIYPNPAQNKISISDLPESREYTVEVFSATGIKAYTSTITNSGNNINLDVSNLHQGLYYVLIKEDNGILKKSKLVIVK
ncbi:MAG: T9SS type A sorting domain-containing protein [Bacteroidia bacterium]|nr:T9SS type A sorting domain-containing protein [Bacteroidia bacterium]